MGTTVSRQQLLEELRRLGFSHRKGQR